MATIKIESLSLMSLRLTLCREETELAHATGFVVQAGQDLLLFSNRHVFSGRNPETGQPLHSRGAIPDAIRVSHHKTGSLGKFVPIPEQLIAQGESPQYVCHPDARVDVAAIRLSRNDAVDYYVTDHKHDTAIQARITVASTVCIIGFPFGLSSYESLPIWKTGSIASEIDLPYQGLPCFLVDAATRGGMSGSPVYAVLRGPYAVEGGGTTIGSSETSRFMGIYSGRLRLPQPDLSGLSEDEWRQACTLGTDIGMVWRPQVIDEVITAAASS